MNRLLAAASLLCLAACGSCRSSPALPVVAKVETKPDLVATIQESETRAMAREQARPECGNRVSIYSGSIPVDASGYTHSVERGDDYVEEEIKALDETFTQAKQLKFTLDYPFEKPFAGTVAGKLTLRHAIDAIRAGFRTMYEGATEREIPGMMNKDVSGKYGSSFHVIGDLVIESIDLCDGDWLEISIGS